MISKLIPMFLLAVGLLTISCGSAPVAETSAESALLSLVDFPPGWTSSTLEASDDSGFSNDCKLYRSKWKLAEADSDQFNGPDDQVVSTAILVYQSDSAAQVALNAGVARLSLCNEEILDTVEKTFTAQGVDATASMVDISFPELGELSSASRIVVELRTTPPRTQVSDNIVIVIGKIRGTFVYSSTGTPDAKEVLQLATKFASRLKIAEEALPTQ